MVAPNYNNSKVYKLVSNKTADVYIGSTVCDLSKRLSSHKKKMNGCSSKKMFADGAVITIILLETVPCKSKCELKARELHYITLMDCINVRKPFVTETSVVDGDRLEWQNAYNKSPQGKATMKKYNQSPEGKAKRKEHRQTSEAKTKRNATRRKNYAAKKLALQIISNETPNVDSTSTS